jgi:hypothetical protein
MYYCDFCFRISQSRVTAKFVLVTGNRDTQETEVWVICAKHADQICQVRKNRSAPGRTVMAKGVFIDDWELAALTLHAQEYLYSRLEPRKLGESS